METRQEREQAQEGIMNRLAAETVRRKTTQHPCTGDDRTCTHRNHRRDADYRLNMLLELGLTEGGNAPQNTEGEHTWERSATAVTLS